MAISVNIGLTIISGDSIVVTCEDVLPETEVLNKTVFDTSADYAEEIMGTKVIRDYSGWVCLKYEGLFDEPLRMKNEQRQIIFLYSVFLPEKIKVKDGYKWLPIKTMMNLNQRAMMEKVLS